MEKAVQAAQKCCSICKKHTETEDTSENIIKRTSSLLPTT